MQKSEILSVTSGSDLAGVSVLIAALNSALLVAGLFAIAAIGLFVFGYIKASMDFRGARVSSLVAAKDDGASATSNAS